MNVKAEIRQAMSKLSTTRPVRCLVKPWMKDRVNVLLYHYAGERMPYYADWDTGYALADFEKDLCAFRTMVEFVPLSELVRKSQSENEEKGSKAFAAITFDDGFDLYRLSIAEVLAKYDIPATAFVITSCLDNELLMWRNGLMAARSMAGEAVFVEAMKGIAEDLGAEPPQSGPEAMGWSSSWPMSEKDRLVERVWSECRLGSARQYVKTGKIYFTWEQLKQWLSEGHEVGLHTSTHPFCNGLTPAEVESEIIEPGKLIRKNLDVDWLPFSYPFGIRISETLEQQLIDSGVFDAAFGIEGFSPRGTAPHRLERAFAEGIHKFEAFAAPAVAMWRSLKTSLRRGR